MNEKPAFTPRPRLAFYHPSVKGTGSAAAFELCPAAGRDEGGVFLTLANQLTVGNRSAPEPTFPTFDWDNRIVVFLGFADICKILQVLRGECEAVEDGKGLYHRSYQYNTKISFRHMVDPVQGYSLEIYRSEAKGTGEWRSRMLFSAWEAAGLAETLSGAMVYVSFGIPEPPAAAQQKGAHAAA